MKQSVTDDEDDHGPLVTFVLLSFNQERFIDAAIDGAFAQTYSPLEILLSDDSSDDRTFEIMQDRTAGYAGAHTIKLNRNMLRQGISGHLNNVMEQACGKLVIIAAGDDVSHPQRTSRIVDEWLRIGKPSCLFHSSYDDMALDGSIIATNVGDSSKNPEPESLLFRNIVVGATEAWVRDLFELYGPLQHTVTHEDRCMVFRAAIADGVHFIPESLVARRRGGLSANVGYSRQDARARNARRYACDASQALSDLETARVKGLLDGTRHAKLTSLVADRLGFEAIMMNDESRWRLPWIVLLDFGRSIRRFVYGCYISLRL